jgi:hypothetical protein
MKTRFVTCACCKRERFVSSRQVFLRAKRDGYLCEQCRRYVTTGIARVTQSIGTESRYSLRLARKLARSAKQTPALAKLKVKRVLEMDSGNAV